VAGADDPQSAVALPAGGVEVEAHADQLAHRSRGEAVAADLVAGERRLLEQEHVGTGAREVEGGAGSGRTGAYDDDVGLPLIGGSPAHRGHLGDLHVT
jgi:hypothetical protein